MRIWQNKDITRACLDYVGANRGGLCALEEQIMFCSTAAEQSLKKPLCRDKINVTRAEDFQCYVKMQV